MIFFYTHKTCPEHSKFSKIYKNGQEFPRFQYKQLADYTKRLRFGFFDVVKTYFVVNVYDELDGSENIGEFHHKTEITKPSWYTKLMKL